MTSPVVWIGLFAAIISCRSCTPFGHSALDDKEGPCEGRFCNGHGTCQQEGFDNYSCWCDDGYKGKDCGEKSAATVFHMDKTADERSNDVHRRESYDEVNEVCKRKQDWQDYFCFGNVVYGCYRYPAHLYAWCWKQEKEGSDNWCWVKRQVWSCPHGTCKDRKEYIKCDDSKSKKDQAVFCADQSLRRPNQCD